MRRWIINSKVLPKPLLDQYGKGSSHQTEDEGGEPEDIDSDIIGRRVEGRGDSRGESNGRV